jgi:hypothetical protein
MMARGNVGELGQQISQCKHGPEFISLDALQFLFPVMETHLESVDFTDGSGWNDDGSHSCSLTTLQE